MLRARFFIIPIVILVLLLTGCGSGQTSTRMGEEFSLRIGQRASMVDEKLEIEFVEVSEDSRCPKKVTCIWEGRVIAVVEMAYGGSVDLVELVQRGLTDQPATATYQEYQLVFVVEPYPEEDEPIRADDYRLRLTVSK